jgi:dihydrofolate reductase
MRRIRYAVAASLDGYIAGPKGEADWILMDHSEFDFNAFFKQFDTVLVGRRTFESMTRAGGGAMPGMKTFVFSRTLQQSDYPKVTIVSEEWQEMLTALRKEPGKDIWLFGGGELFRSLASASWWTQWVCAVLLRRGGIPLLPSPAK